MPCISLEDEILKPSPARTSFVTLIRVSSSISPSRTSPSGKRVVRKRLCGCRLVTRRRYGSPSTTFVLVQSICDVACFACFNLSSYFCLGFLDFCYPILVELNQKQGYKST